MRGTTKQQPTAQTSHNRAARKLRESNPGPANKPLEPQAARATRNSRRERGDRGAARTAVLQHCLRAL
eukprot:2909789-Lingulodinium_polyedra.AAC.1